MNLYLKRAVFVLALGAGCIARAKADVGIVLYESKGVDVRRTGTGHVALIATNLCASGIDKLRKCEPGEAQGAVVTRYANVAPEYPKTLFVVPILDHFTATSDARLVPALSSGGTLEAMQMEYWQNHLKPYLPPLTHQRYEEIKANLDRFDAGRTLRRALTMEYLMMLLGPQKKKYPTEPIAIIHPVTKELIPNGRWRESVGAQQGRSSLILTLKTKPEQEERLIGVVEKVSAREFNALNDNCSDFVAEALLEVFRDSGMSLRPRIFHVADAWITTPLAVATDFTSFAKRQKIPMQVTVVPMNAGTRRPTAGITSISRGALVPDASQGKMAFLMKVYFNYLNPLLGGTSFVADQATRFVDLQDLVHQRGTPELSRISNEMQRKKPVPEEDRRALKREQIKSFGATSCWQSKRDQFARIEAQATELGLLTAGEKSLLLRQGQPYLLPRLYEHLAASRGYDGALMAGIEDCVIPGCGQGVAAGMFGNNIELKEVTRGVPVGFVPGREEIRDLAGSEDRSKQVAAFKLMTSLINFDLTSEPISRRMSSKFDPDWGLYLDVAQKNGVKIPEVDKASDTIADCSCRAFDSGSIKTDSYQEDRSLANRLKREVRGLVNSPNR